jgi:hypothetical protein
VFASCKEDKLKRREVFFLKIDGLLRARMGEAIDEDKVGSSVASSSAQLNPGAQL